MYVCPVCLDRQQEEEKNRTWIFNTRLLLLLLLFHLLPVIARGDSSNTSNRRRRRADWVYARCLSAIIGEKRRHTSWSAKYYINIFSNKLNRLAHWCPTAVWFFCCCWSHGYLCLMPVSIGSGHLWMHSFHGPLSTHKLGGGKVWRKDGWKIQKLRRKGEEKKRSERDSGKKIKDFTPLQLRALFFDR